MRDSRDTYERGSGKGQRAFSVGRFALYVLKTENTNGQILD